MNIIPCIFKTKINNGLKCPFCNKIFTDPVLATGCGHSFCKRCTEGKSACPHDDREFENIISNISLLEQISQLEIYCRYGCKISELGSSYEIDPNGCPEIIKFGERNSHEATCPFSFVSCPQNPKCPAIRKKDLNGHLENCQKVPCVHASRGCLYRGLAQEVEEHLGSCHYEALSGFICRTDDRVSELQTELADSKQDIDGLRDLLGTLTLRCDSAAESAETSVVELQKTVNGLTKENNYLKDHLRDLNEFVNVLARQYEAMMFQQNFRCLGTFVGHQGPVWCLCAQGDLLFTSSSDANIKVWDISSEFLCIKTLEGHRDPVLCLTILNKRLFSGGKDNTIGEWCLDTLINVRLVKDAHPDQYISALIGHDSNLYSGSNGSVKIWNAADLGKGPLHEITGLDNWVRCLAVNNTSLYIGVNKVQVHSLVPATSHSTVAYGLLAELVCPKPDSHIHSMLFLDRSLVCGTSLGDIYIWDYTTQSLLNRLSGHGDRINSLSCIFVSGVWKLFSASNDRTIRVWRLDHMVCTQILARHQGSVQSILWWKSRLFSGAVDTSIKVWVAGT